MNKSRNNNSKTKKGVKNTVKVAKSAKKRPKKAGNTAETASKLYEVPNTIIQSPSDCINTVGQKRFAQGVCFKKMFFIFLLGSVIGAYYEQVLYFVQTWWETGVGIWSVRRGVIYGPFNVIYGFGAVLMIGLLARKPMKNWQIFLSAAVVGGVVEYLISFLQEFFTHTVSWDYSHQFLNINGRTTLPFMLVWGLLGLVLVKVIYPPVSDAIEKVPVKIGNIVFVIAFALMSLDMFVSWTALIRQTLRHNNVPPLTVLGEFYDEYYTDEYLQKFYPNMTHLDQQKDVVK